MDGSNAHAYCYLWVICFTVSVSINGIYIHSKHHLSIFFLNCKHDTANVTLSITKYSSEVNNIELTWYSSVCMQNNTFKLFWIDVWVVMNTMIVITTNTQVFHSYKVFKLINRSAKMLRGFLNFVVNGRNILTF